ncbi:LLM class flavin-dependent oxidoreductase, partial [Mycobacterium avium]
MSTFGLSVLAPDLAAMKVTATAADQAGFDAVWASEFYTRSGSISMAAMATSTDRCRIGSSILYGVGRSPLVLATEARDLDELSGGRIVLGIGNGTKRMMSNWHSVADTSAPALRV